MRKASPETGNARTSVWWDIENCRPPSDVNPYDIALNIRTVLHTLNFSGPLSIAAYGDSYQLSRDVQNALTSTGITLNHIPSGRKDASDKAILVNLAFWSSDNPPPANILLISGDRDFSPILHQLRMRRFNVLLARPEGVQVSECLLNAATSVWYWSKLVRAEVDSLTSPRVSRITTQSVISCKVRTPSFPASLTNPMQPRLPSQLMSVVRPRQQGPLTYCSQVPTAGIIRPTYPQGPAALQGFPGMPNFFGGTRPVYSQAQWFPVGNGNLDYVRPVMHYVQPSPAEQHYYQCRTVIKKALDALRLEKMLPTKCNIYNCITYGENFQLTFSLRQALDQGVSVGDLVTKHAGPRGDLQIFLPAGHQLWDYVDANFVREYDSDIWNGFRKFLCSDGVQAFVNSANQYHAALVIRRHGIGRLSDLALAEIYNIIQLAVCVRAWIKPHPQNWSPLLITKGRGTSTASPAVVPESPGKGVVNRQRASKAASAVQATNKPSTMEQLKAWLPSMLSKKGYDISLIRRDFQEAHGIPLDHQALGFPKLLDLVRQLPDVAQIRSPRSGLCKLYRPGVTTMAPKSKSNNNVMQMLRTWLIRFMASKRDVCDLASACRKFERECNIKLDPSALGFPGINQVFEQFSDIVRVERLQSGLLEGSPNVVNSVATGSKSSSDPYGHTELFLKLVTDCRNFLLEMIPTCKAGYPLARLKVDFQRRYGYALDHARVGFNKLEAFLEIMKDCVGVWTCSGGHKLLYLKDVSGADSAVNMESLVISQASAATNIQKKEVAKPMAEAANGMLKNTDAQGSTKTVKVVTSEASGATRKSIQNKEVAKPMVEAANGMTDAQGSTKSTVKADAEQVSSEANKQRPKIGVNSLPFGVHIWKPVLKNVAESSLVIEPSSPQISLIRH